MQPVTLYTTRFCPYCLRAKHLHEQKGVKYHEIAIDSDSAARQEMMQKSGRRTVPQIWIAEHHVGDCDDLMALEAAGELDTMLNGG